MQKASCCNSSPVMDMENVAILIERELYISTVSVEPGLTNQMAMGLIKLPVQ